jgi:DNA invertase Pin-like site-specific DNA recombinase
MFFDGRSTEEIMRLYNWNNSTVYSQKNKLLARLKKLVRKITTENVCL